MGIVLNDKMEGLIICNPEFIGLMMELLERADELTQLEGIQNLGKLFTNSKNCDVVLSQYSCAAYFTPLLLQKVSLENITPTSDKIIHRLFDILSLIHLRGYQRSGTKLLRSGPEILRNTLAYIQISCVEMKLNAMPIIWAFLEQMLKGLHFKNACTFLPFVEEMILFPPPQESGLKQIVGISDVNTLLISTIRMLKDFISSDNGDDEAYILNLFISLLIIVIKETTLAFDKAEENTLLLLLTILNNMVKLNNNNNNSKWYKALEKTLHDVHRVYGNTYTYNMDIVEKIEQRRNEDIVRSIDKREKMTEKLKSHFLFHINFKFKVNDTLS